MQAIYSTINIQHSNQAADFRAILSDLLEHPLVSKMHDYSQHLNTSRYQHSLNVAYYSYKFAKKWNLDVESTTRAAFLHDLFLYEWRTEQPVAGNHIDVHPQQALLNAKTITEVNPLMQDIIQSHMWPLGKFKPQSKEAWLVSTVDKICMQLEVMHQLTNKTKRVTLSPLALSLVSLIK